MCFSATASFMAAAPLSAVGGVTITKVKEKSQLPFAAFPLLFAIQQAIEGVVWLTFSQPMPVIHMIATYAYTIFAFVFWPIFVPFAIRLLETIPWRKNLMTVFQIMGLVVGLYLLYFIVKFHVTSKVMHQIIVYHFPQPFAYPAMLVYAGASCLPLFFSSHKFINFFGVLLVLSMVITFHFYLLYDTSIWCFFAAILSGIVYLYFATLEKRINSHKKALQLS